MKKIGAVFVTFCRFLSIFVTNFPSDLYILNNGPVSARTGWPIGYRNWSNEVGDAAQPPPTTTIFRWKAICHRHAGQQTAGARRHRGITGQRVESGPPCSQKWWFVATYHRLCPAQRCDKGPWRLSYSKHIGDSHAVRHLETHLLRSHRLHSRVSSGTPTPSVTWIHRLQSGWGSILMDTGYYGTERSWPLLSTQSIDSMHHRSIACVACIIDNMYSMHHRSIAYITCIIDR